MPRRSGNDSRRGNGGPLGMVIGALGTGIGAAAEYREHRKEQKLSRENSQQNVDEAEAGPSNTLMRPAPHATSSSDLAAPPSYTNVVGSSQRSLSSGTPATQDKKAALTQGYEGDYVDDDEDVEDDEEDWQLDEMLQSREGSPPAPPTYSQSEQSYGNTDALVREVLEKHPRALSQGLQQQEQPFARSPLPCPVILPERRPGSKARGFVRAYAPLLGECSGIDQDTFITFLENFDKSTKASPAFTVIQLAAGVVGFVPEPICQAVSTAMQVSARAGAAAHGRIRTNDFLDKMNDELFKPAGLFAMIVKYQTEAEVEAAAAGGNPLLAKLGVSSAVMDLNTNQTIAKYTQADDAAGKTMSQRMQKLRLASGKTQGAINLPAAAPLIFPSLDKAILKEGPETFTDKTKDARNFLISYMDRRAQVKYAEKDPTSSLILPEEQRTFRSKLADPSHPMYNGGPAGFLSGGYLTPGRSQDAYEDNADYRRRSRSGDRDDRRRPRDDGRHQRRRGRGGLIGGLLSTAMNVGSAGGSTGAATGPGRSREYEDSYNTPAPTAPYGPSAAPYGYEDENDPYGSSDAAARARGPRDYSSSGRMRGGGRRGGGSGGAASMIKRVMKEDVLYLTIVNLPSEEELALARRQIEAAKNAR